jgi:hypothetical protein
MTTATGTRLGLLVCALGGLSMTLACSDPAVHEPEGPTLPTSNDRIVRAVTFGTLPSSSTIHELHDDGLGGSVFMGIVDGVYSIGSIGTEGQRSWTTAMDPRLNVEDLTLLPRNAPEMSEAIVWVGGFDRGDDGLLDDGTIGLMSSHGEELDSLMISRPQARIWINSVARAESLDFIAMGGAFEAGAHYPVVAQFQVEGDGTVTLRDSRVLTEFENEYFGEVLVDEARVGPDGFTVYVSGERVREGGRLGHQRPVDEGLKGGHPQLRDRVGGPHPGRRRQGCMGREQDASPP